VGHYLETIALLVPVPGAIDSGDAELVHFSSPLWPSLDWKEERSVAPAGHPTVQVDRGMVVMVLNNLGQAYLQLGDAENSTAMHARALALLLADLDLADAEADRASTDALLDTVAHTRVHMFQARKVEASPNGL
jgi:hypothetical protein